MPQFEYDVAGRTVTHELLNGTESENPHVQAEIERAYQRFQLQFGMRIAHQDHFRGWLHAHQPAKGPQRLGNALVRLQESEDADERCGLVQAQTIAKFRAVGLRNPGAVRNAINGARKSRAAQFSFNATAMHD